MSRPLTILYEDEALLFVDKPARVMSVPPPGGDDPKRGPAVTARLKEQGFRVRALHRLDYETSGVMVFAKTPEAEKMVVHAFKQREVEKSYIALVEGWPRPHRGQIDYPIKDLGSTAVISKQGKVALTHYEVIEEQGPCSLVSCRIPTGRHNQIRLHFAQLGHPLVGERKFAKGGDAIMSHKRALLHAVELTLVSPATGESVTVRAPLPPDFKKVLEQARKLPSRLHQDVDRNASRGRYTGTKSRLRRGNPGRRPKNPRRKP